MKKLILLLILIAGTLVVSGQKIADLTRATTTVATDLLIIDQTATTSGISIGNFFNTVLFGDGTVLLPSISLLTDPNTGIYTTGADAISVGVGGVEAVRFVESTTTQALFGDGVMALPSISFINDPGLGFYRENNNVMNVSVNGSRTWQFSVTQMGTRLGNARFVSGSATSTSPNILPAGGGTDEDTGIGRAGADSLSLIAGGVEGIRIAEGGGKIKVTITDTLNLEALATATTTVLTPTSTGNVDTLETADIADLTLASISVDSVGVNAYLIVDGVFNYAADAQGNDDYEIDIPGITALVAGLQVTFLASTANTDGATLEITSVGDLDAILKQHDTVLTSNDIEAGSIVVVVFDGTNWQMVSPVAN